MTTTTTMEADSSSAEPATPSSAEAIDKIRASNWGGSIPVSLSLAPSSLFSPTIPPPIHVLVSRNTFLHVGLQQAVLRLHKFAPPTFSFHTRKVIEEPENVSKEEDDEDGGESSSNHGDKKDENDKKEPEHKPVSYPVCWFEDETSELPLRWQLFAGILYDSHVTKAKLDPTACNLPWKIRVHFTQYPSSHLLNLEADHVLTTIEKTFKHSLKQALVLQHGNNKVALNMTKQSHQQLWDSIVTGKYSVYKLLQDDIQATNDAVESIPIRLLLGSSNNKPLIQKRFESTTNTTTLGDLLLEWAPQYFEKNNDDETVQPKSTAVSWRVSGIVPPLTTSLVDLWQTLCHPDSFLYVSLLIQ